MFNRDWEWSELTGFATREHPGNSLGVVSGRRRQGKTFLLQALARATGGFYFAATEATEAQSLRRLGAAIARHTGARRPLRFDDWEDASHELFRLGANGPTPVIIDEFPYLVRSSPSLPSILQAVIGVRTMDAHAPRPRLLLCGSALSFMGGLLSGTAPLRGRAGLELIVHSLNYREAARFWGIESPRLAVMVNAIVGGTPAYRREFAGDDAPDGPDDFDDWVCRTVLNPARPIYREAPYLLAEEADLRDRSLYHSVLAAVAGGNHTRGGIADSIGRKATDISLPLTVLQGCGLLNAEPDAFRGNRTSYRIAEPLIAFHHSIIEPSLDWLNQNTAADVWARSQERFNSQVLGPHFEKLCRDWVSDHADIEVFGGLPTRVAQGTVADPERRTSIELDVVVHGAIGQDNGILLSIGEAKWNKVMDLRHLERLQHALRLLAAKGIDTTHSKPACYSGLGFSDDLREAERRGDVVLVDLDRLYGGA
ncbi:AAA family ATPase [Actinacidiphila soli]|uniref:AAA family ATPase n=1 Tax=Actinacidiphila soli TaxID=2487275 RepID=UPI0019D003D3|nr:ATP-binding protein [Actinacidiphila soli]